RDLLAQIEAVDAFMGRMQAYPGRTFGQPYQPVFRTHDLANAPPPLTERTIARAGATVPLLAIAGRGDGIAPVPACHHVGDLVPNAASVQLDTAPARDPGLLTSRAP